MINEKDLIIITLLIALALLVISIINIIDIPYDMEEYGLTIQTTIRIICVIISIPYSLWLFISSSNKLENIRNVERGLIYNE